jgi:alpha-amylase/alpha-mannosidase (GH57 family)
MAIHGHFYQPPRENPWLEAVETQDSAHPYHDWNERVTNECYWPNTSARILDANDRILHVVNNYASINFNFGATLLSWLEGQSPQTYAAILEADRLSRERFGGQGSAIAQAYNHMIMPLAGSRDQRTQVLWGIRDFEARFGRKPEGMWLPETAVDVSSLDALAEAGIAFTILAPHQAFRYRAIGEDKWIANGGIDPTRAYRCNLPSGRSIDLFFYDGPIARAVAFEYLLARGENLANRLAGAFSKTREQVQLVHIATDGETYGHHHRNGEMALAYAMHYIEEKGLARITNYGQFLADHPPAHEVEIVENTAWSCSHGIERWRSDCGCNTGSKPGWNQQWRKPLRTALDWLRDEVALIFEWEGKSLLRDTWRARDEYIDVVLDRSEESVERFLAKHALVPGVGSASSRPPGGSEEPPHTQVPAGSRHDTTTRILQLMEMQRNAMLMYTSCGWFFSDVSGIETVQVLHYAARVVQLAEELSGRALEPELLRRLEPANSNLPERGTARQIYEREVVPMRLDLSRVAAHYAVASLFDHFDDEAVVYCYRVRRSDFQVAKTGRARMAVASITVSSIITGEEASFELSVLHLGETELTGGVRATGDAAAYQATSKELVEAMQPGGIPAVIRILDREFAAIPVSIRSLFRDQQRRILNILCNATLKEAESAFRQLHERYDPLMRFHTRLGIPLPKVLQTAAEFDLNVQLRQYLELGDHLPIAEIEARLREAQEEGVSLDETTRMALKSAVERAAERFRQKPDEIERLDAYATLVSVIRGSKMYVNMRKPQNDYYRMKKEIRPSMAAEAAHTGNGNGVARATRWLEVFDQLGDNLGIAPEAGDR